MGIISAIRAKSERELVIEDVIDANDHLQDYLNKNLSYDRNELLIRADRLDMAVEYLPEVK